MIDLGPHAIFIVSAYIGVILVTSLLIIWVWTRSKKQKLRLADLDARGIHRRSDSTEAQTETQIQ